MFDTSKINAMLDSWTTMNAVCHAVTFAEVNRAHSVLSIAHGRRPIVTVSSLVLKRFTFDNALDILEERVDEANGVSSSNLLAILATDATVTSNEVSEWVTERFQPDIHLLKLEFKRCPDPVEEIVGYIKIDICNNDQDDYPIRDVNIAPISYRALLHALSNVGYPSAVHPILSESAYAALNSDASELHDVSYERYLSDIGHEDFEQGELAVVEASELNTEVVEYLINELQCVRAQHLDEAEVFTALVGFCQKIAKVINVNTQCFMFNQAGFELDKCVSASPSRWSITKRELLRNCIQFVKSPVRCSSDISQRRREADLDSLRTKLGAWVMAIETESLNETTLLIDLLRQLNVIIESLSHDVQFTCYKLIINQVPDQFGLILTILQNCIVFLPPDLVEATIYGKLYMLSVGRRVDVVIDTRSAL